VAVMMMVMAMMPPVVVMMMAMRPPMVMMMMAPPVVVIVMVSPLHLGRQLAGVALRSGDARTDRRCRLRLLRWSRDNQKRTDCGKSQNFFQKHVEISMEWKVRRTAAGGSIAAAMRATRLGAMM
jgi:hypothetical protein